MVSVKLILDYHLSGKDTMKRRLINLGKLVGLVQCRRPRMDLISLVYLNENLCFSKPFVFETEDSAHFLHWIFIEGNCRFY